jgi:hypothetical protein
MSFSGEDVAIIGNEIGVLQLEMFGVPPLGGSSFRASSKKAPVNAELRTFPFGVPTDVRNFRPK